MELRSSYRYVAEASAPEGRRLGELLVVPDFAPAAEWSHWQGVRRGLPALAHHGAGVVEPVFDEELKPPYVAGIRVHFDAADTAYEAPVISFSYFHPCVERSATRLVEEGVLRVGESFVYRICAFPLHGGPLLPRTPIASVVDAAPTPLALEREPLAPRLARAIRLGEAAWDAMDFPVFVQAAVLDEATEMAHTAGERETGGILVGHLRRDMESSETYAEITAQIPATHARAGRAHLNFTPETWSAVRDALAVRRRGEIWIGWWHYHPHWCRRCSEDRRRQCVLSRPFFSRDDCELHRTVFDAAFSVALLLSDVGEDSLRYDWFGWRYGSIAARGCHLLPAREAPTSMIHAAASTRPAARVLSMKEDDHEQ